MIAYHACSKCDSPVRRSRRRNLLEFLIAPIMLPYRCTICDKRELKLRFIDVDAKPEDEDEIDTEGFDVGDIPVEPIPEELTEAARIAEEALKEAHERLAEAKEKADEARKNLAAKREEVAARAAAIRAERVAVLKKEAEEKEAAERKARREKEAAEGEGDDDEPRPERKKSGAGSGKGKKKRKRVMPPDGEAPELVASRPGTLPSPQSHTSDEEEEQIWPS